MLEIKNLTKKYKNGILALDQINLTINKGMFGLLGANGAGKSSLMRTIATLQQPDSGSITFGGIDGINEPQKIREVLGYLPQEFGIMPSATPETLLNQIAFLKGISDKMDRKESVGYFLNKVNLHAQRTQRLGTFSGGMLRRFGIAQALIGNPKLIIVDEPTAGLDPKEKTNFYNILSEFSDDAVVILSTHIVEDIQRLCNNMALIASGKVIAKGNPVSLVNELNNTVWKKEIERDEFEVLKATHKVIRHELIAGKLHVYVHAPAKPDTSFESVKPVLEDFFFLNK